MRRLFTVRRTSWIFPMISIGHIEVTLRYLQHSIIVSVTCIQSGGSIQQKDSSIEYK